jgi:hypothetical protein
MYRTEMFFCGHIFTTHINIYFKNIQTFFFQEKVDLCFAFLIDVISKNKGYMMLEKLYTQTKL